MAKSKTAAARTFDPRSEDVVLEYQGRPAEGDDPGWEPVLFGVPARDLTEHDICRLVYQDGVTAYDGSELSPPMPDPESPDQAKCAAWVDLLLERRVDGRAVYALAPINEDAEPAAPADEPEA